MINRPLVKQKTKLLDKAISYFEIRSICDVGGCWGVNGGYAFHALETGVERAFILDGKITNLTLENAEKYGYSVQLIQTNLGDADMVKGLPDVDATIFFDVLLHQVSPDWDKFISLYTCKSDVIVIYNQAWTGDSKTLRFVDKGLEWYLANVYYTDRERVISWFNKHNEYNLMQNRLWRDVHNFWQWGIVADDLIRLMRKCGFDLWYFKNYGQWFNNPMIEKHGYIFKRRWNSRLIKEMRKCILFPGTFKKK